MVTRRGAWKVGGILGHQPFPQSLCSLVPPGLYGHSAVYHEATDSLYVFGGFRFHVELAAPSPELYSLHCPDRTWSLLAPSQGAKVRKRGADIWILAAEGRTPFPVSQGLARPWIPTPFPVP